VGSRRPEINLLIKPFKPFKPSSRPVPCSFFPKKSLSEKKLREPADHI